MASYVLLGMLAMQAFIATVMLATSRPGLILRITGIASIAGIIFILCMGVLCETSTPVYP